MRAFMRAGRSRMSISSAPGTRGGCVRRSTRISRPERRRSPSCTPSAPRRLRCAPRRHLSPISSTGSSTAARRWRSTAGRAWHIKRTFDADAMAQAAQALIGRHDFSTFRDSQCQAKSPLRTLDRFEVTRRRRRDRVRGRRAFVPAPAGALDGRLVGRGGLRQMERARICKRRTRRRGSRAAAGRSRRPRALSGSGGLSARRSPAAKYSSSVRS